MREIELKSVVDDIALHQRWVEEAGGTLHFTGTMVDRYYTRASSPDRGSERLRVRTYQAAETTWTELTWKGPARLEHGYKEREELTTRVENESVLRELLERIGLTEYERIVREIAWYTYGGAMLRFERFPRMDMLVEVEGPPEAIEHAIRVTGIPRSHFTADSLVDFIHRFEARTGKAALLSGSNPCEGRGDAGA